MPSTASMAERSAAAVKRLNKVAAHAGAPQQPVPAKDTELGHVIQLENAAALAEHLAAAQGIEVSPDVPSAVPPGHKRLEGSSVINAYQAPKEDAQHTADAVSGKAPSLQQQRALAKDPTIDQLQIPGSTESKAVTEAQKADVLPESAADMTPPDADDTGDVPAHHRHAHGHGGHSSKK